jgi:hypothetical protein
LTYIFQSYWFNYYKFIIFVSFFLNHFWLIFINFISKKY